MLNFFAIETIETQTTPYPHFVVTNSLVEDKKDILNKDFPKIEFPGSLPIEDIIYGDGFKELLRDIESDKFREIIAKKFDLDLKDKPIMITCRGQMREKDGRIHADSKTKLATILIYFNKDWTNESGRLRVLKNKKDLNDYTAEVIPELGTMMAFKVTDNSWHGHTPLTGERKSIQINFLIDSTSENKHKFFHNISLKLKRLFSKDDY